VAAGEGFIADVFAIQRPVEGIFVQVVVIQQFFLAGAVGGPCIQVNLAVARGVENNRV
jgi:hypothetical protein